MELRTGTGNEEDGSHRETDIHQATEKALRSFYNLKTTQNEPTMRWRPRVVDSEARFRIWASNIGGHVDVNSTDAKLREASHVRARILISLAELIETNEEILGIMAGRRAEETEQLSAADNQDADSTQSELNELFLGLEDVLDSLMKVSALIRSRIERSRAGYATATALQLSMPTGFDIAHVAQKHPKLNQRPELLSRFGELITQRRGFLAYARDHHEHIALDPVEAGLNLKHRDALQHDGSPMSVSTDQTNMHSSLTHASTSSTSLRSSDLPAVTTIDSGAQDTSEASSSASPSDAEENGSNLDVIDFHTLSSEDDVLGLGLIDAASRIQQEIAPAQCCFCDDWDQRLRAERLLSDGTLTAAELLVSAKDFYQHLAQHMEQLALFAIPPDASFQTLRDVGGVEVDQSKHANKRNLDSSRHTLGPTNIGDEREPFLVAMQGRLERTHRPDDFDEHYSEPAEIIDHSGKSAKNTKPGLAYSQLTGMAILSTAKHEMTLDNICSWIMSNYAFYRFASAGWQSNVRNTLLFNDVFTKIPRRADEPDKVSTWTIKPSDFDDLVKQLTKHYGIENSQITTGAVPAESRGSSVTAIRKNVMSSLGPGQAQREETRKSQGADELASQQSDVFSRPAGDRTGASPRNFEVPYLPPAFEGFDVNPSSNLDLDGYLNNQEGESGGLRALLVLENLDESRSSIGVADQTIERDRLKDDRPDEPLPAQSFSSSHGLDPQASNSVPDTGPQDDHHDPEFNVLQVPTSTIDGYEEYRRRPKQVRREMGTSSDVGPDSDFDRAKRLRRRLHHQRDLETETRSMFFTAASMTSSSNESRALSALRNSFDSPPDIIGMGHLTPTTPGKGRGRSETEEQRDEISRRTG
ncbi:unnamed protein product [Zymoseptoria tritici ST99CH_1E4]|uniref:Fork-head domain-containing protein n=1 Tax=Zymoseptoria tritici ST99CH_1E4 TaxID=1276532 RepID=A0A2H1GY67_ZYMTR|nr:unnamed protein product [Zymoseptoria tritici ST99CH_1E4]